MPYLVEFTTSVEVDAPDADSAIDRTISEITDENGKVDIDIMNPRVD